MTGDTRSPDGARHQHYRATLGQRRARIVDRWIELRLVRWSRPGVDQLRSWVRELADQSTEFGYPALADLARELQQRVEAAIGDKPPYQELIGSITATVERMNLLVDQVQQSRAAPRTPAKHPSRSKVLIAEPDPDAGALIETLVLSHGMEARVVRDAAGLPGPGSADGTDLVIIDEALLSTVDEQFGVDAAQRPGFGGIPWILMSRQPDIGLRMRALQAGATACLASPADVHELGSALLLATLARSTLAVNVQIVADAPELAERHADAMRAAGLTPLLGAELADLPDVLAAQAADALLLDINADARQRELWLRLLADTPGFDSLPVVCLADRQPASTGSHRRTTMVACSATTDQVALALRRAVLENARDQSRLARLATIRAHDRLCTAEVFMSRLAAAVAAGQRGDGDHALLVIEFDDAASLLRARGPDALLERQQALERALLDVLGDCGCCTRLGSIGMRALWPLAAAVAGQLEALLSSLSSRIEPAAGSPARCRAVAVPLGNAFESAAEACRLADASLREAREATGPCWRVVEPAAPAPAAAASPLPLDRMAVRIRALLDARGDAQPLHDATIHLHDGNGNEQPLAVLLADVVEHGWATELDTWEMSSVADQLREWPVGPSGVEVSMRLSTASRRALVLVPIVREIVVRLPPGRGFRLVFEVAESWLVEHNAAAVEMVEALRGLGCGVMLGDFGGTDNPRNLAWASWFDYARLSDRRMAQLAGDGPERAATEKLVRSAADRGARVIGSNNESSQVRGTLADWGVGLFG